MRAFLPLAILMLAACAGGPMDAPRPLGPAKVTPNAIVGEATLPLTIWRPAGEAKAVILALHGFGDYGPSTFGDAAAFWAIAAS